MGSLVHTGLGSSSLVAHVLHYPPPTHANSVVMGTAVINTHIMIACSRAGSSPQKKNLATHQFMERNTEGHCDAKSVIYPLQSPSQSSHSGLSNFCHIQISGIASTLSTGRSPLTFAYMPLHGPTPPSCSHMSCHVHINYFM